MIRDRSRPVVMGRVARAELCACAGSLVLSVGCLSLRLDPALAEDVATTLNEALVQLRGEAGPVEPDATPFS